MSAKIIFIIIVVVAVATGYFFWQNQNMSESVQNQDQSKNSAGAADPAVPEQAANGGHIITLKTNFGDIQLETYDADAPRTAVNFIWLVHDGFYSGLTFHRVIKGFMIQGGDPNCGSTSSPQARSGPCGSGGPGYKFEDELNPATPSYKAGYKKGVVAMANAGPNTNGSQFFIMLKDYPLPNNYSIFGKVIKGQEVVDAIGNVKTGESYRPISPVVIQRAVVE